MDEAHVEHAVGLVEDEHLDIVEAHRAAVVEVEQAARRRHQHVDPARQRADLLADRHAADDQRRRDAEMAAVGGERIDDLAAELAGRRQHQHAAALRLQLLRVAGEAMEDGEREGGGLAGAGLGNADEVASGKGWRDGGRLDRRRRGIALLDEGAGNGLGKAESIKAHSVTCLSNTARARGRLESGRRGSRVHLDIPRGLGCRCWWMKRAGKPVSGSCNAARAPLIWARSCCIATTILASPPAAPSPPRRPGRRARPRPARKPAPGRDRPRPAA